MTLTFELDLNIIKMNQRATKYVAIHFIRIHTHGTDCPICTTKV